ncbi:hypothetical protein [Streptomyces sp. PT12]|uniref:hypothetical protein n=1 Tax=Streptomyces sp. PT12 TaxID=1510197 RepID=UPI000DE2C61B|nr:hypothetical protein [Streptomyces sp. PT12]RBM09018.1 hypothetical protein DEH69_23495 [Streptomyces sp. PT12]
MRVPQQPTYHRLIVPLSAPRPAPRPEPPPGPAAGGGHRWPLWLALAVSFALLVTAATGWLLRHGAPQGSAAPRAPGAHALPVTDIDR